MKNSLLFIRSLVLAMSFAVSAAFADISEPVNVNTADAETLAQVLNGIGAKRAQAIVKWRRDHGPFTSIDQLTNVRGVGGDTLAKNRDRIVLD